MATISFDAVKGYYIQDTSRPTWEGDDKIYLAEMFVQTPYAKKTTLAEFVSEFGALDSLHRRHIIPWKSILDVVAKAMNLIYSGKAGDKQIYKDLLKDMALYIDKDGLSALTQAHNEASKSNHAQAAVSLSGFVNLIGKSHRNVFVGPGRYNSSLGNKFDGGEDVIKASELNELKIFYPWQHTAMQGLANLYDRLDGFLKG